MGVSLFNLRGLSFRGVRAPSVVYTGAPFAWTYGVAIATESPTSSGGAVTSYAVVAGALPTGVSLNATTGDLTGTPTQETYAGTVTIRATGPGGTSSAICAFTVSRAPVIDYAGTPFTWDEDQAIAPASVSSTGGQVTSYAVQAGALPTGVSLNTSTGALTGTPTTAGTGSATIRATGPGGTEDAAIDWTVTAAPSMVSFSPTNGPTNQIVSITLADMPNGWLLSDVTVNGVSLTNIGKDDETTCHGRVGAGVSTGAVVVSYASGASSVSSAGLTPSVFTKT